MVAYGSKGGGGLTLPGAAAEGAASDGAGAEGAGLVRGDTAGAGVVGYVGTAGGGDGVVIGAAGAVTGAETAGGGAAYGAGVVTGVPYAGGDVKSGGVTGGAANAEEAGGGAANVVGGAAESGCVAVGNCTRCDLASSANRITSAATMNRTNAFNTSTKWRHEKRPRPTSAQPGRGGG